MRRTTSRLLVPLLLCTAAFGCRDRRATARTDASGIIIAHTRSGCPDTGDEVCFLDMRGDTVIPFGKYRYGITDTVRHIGFVLHDGKWAAIDNRGRRLFTPYLLDNGPDYPSEGLFRITDEHGLIGFADTSGRIVIKPRYIFATPFSNGVARVACDSADLATDASSRGGHYIDRHGRTAYAPRQSCK